MNESKCLLSQKFWRMSAFGLQILKPTKGDSVALLEMIVRLCYVTDALKSFSPFRPILGPVI